MEFEETYIAQIRGGIVYDRIFSYSNKIGPLLDEKIIPFIKKHFNNIKNINTDTDGVLFEANNGKLKLGISDSRISHGSKSMPMNNVNSYLMEISNYYNTIIRDMSLSEKINGVGIEFTYIIPLLENKALKIIENNIFKNGANPFLLDKTQTSKRYAIEFNCQLKNMAVDIAISTTDSNNGISIVVDNTIFSESKHVDYEDFHRAAYENLSLKINEKFLKPILALECVDGELLCKGTKESKE